MPESCERCGQPAAVVFTTEYRALGLRESRYFCAEHRKTALHAIDGQIDDAVDETHTITAMEGLAEQHWRQRWCNPRYLPATAG